MNCFRVFFREGKSLWSFGMASSSVEKRGNLKDLATIKSQKERFQVLWNVYQAFEKRRWGRGGQLLNANRSALCLKYWTSLQQINKNEKVLLIPNPFHSSKHVRHREVKLGNLRHSHQVLSASPVWHYSLLCDTIKFRCPCGFGKNWRMFNT